MRISDWSSDVCSSDLDCTPRYCFADPVEGGKQAIAEAWRNITAVGATPLAVTNCLNFANPQRPDIMGQFVGCLEGMGAACIALEFPIVSGNVSLYNESKEIGRGACRERGCQDVTLWGVAGKYKKKK